MVGVSISLSISIAPNDTFLFLFSPRTFHDFNSRLAPGHSVEKRRVVPVENSSVNCAMYDLAKPSASHFTRYCCTVRDPKPNFCAY